MKVSVLLYAYYVYVMTYCIECWMSLNVSNFCFSLSSVPDFSNTGVSCICKLKTIWLPDFQQNIYLFLWLCTHTHTHKQASTHTHTHTLTHTLTHIYIWSSCSTASTDFPDPLLPPVPIVLFLPAWRVMWFIHVVWVWVMVIFQGLCFILIHWSYPKR